MKKICLFSTKATKDIEGDEAELHVNFYLVLDRDYIFTFLIDAPNLACSGRNPIKLWKEFLLMFEKDSVKYMRRCERYEKSKRSCDNRDAIEALEKEPEAMQFAKWVATEIFDENWEYNKDAFEELACRKLAKLGIVRAKGDEWELVELSEGKDKG